jgi:hypothetical protein
MSPPSSWNEFNGSTGHLKTRARPCCIDSVVQVSVERTHRRCLIDGFAVRAPAMSPRGSWVGRQTFCGIGQEGWRRCLSPPSRSPRGARRPRWRVGRSLCWRPADSAFAGTDGSGTLSGRSVLAHSYFDQNIGLSPAEMWCNPAPKQAAFTRVDTARSCARAHACDTASANVT